MNRYGIALGMGFEESVGEQIVIAANAGFQTVATNWNENLDAVSFGKMVQDNGLECNYLHAPFTAMDTVWEEGRSGDEYVDMLIRGLDGCVAAGTSNYVCHVIIGMDKHSPNELGLVRIGRLLDEAKARNVKIAFENTEGLEYLESVMTTFAQHPSCFFCWDTGHELCYNFSQDMLALYGDRLTITHLDDNLGMADKNNMTSLDDSHLLPGDGIADWPGIVRRLKAHGFSGVYNLELSRKNRPGRTANDIYASLSCQKFMEKALAAIKSFAD